MRKELLLGRIRRILRKNDERLIKARRDWEADYYVVDIYRNCIVHKLNEADLPELLSRTDD